MGIIEIDTPMFILEINKPFGPKNSHVYGGVPPKACDIIFDELYELETCKLNGLSITTES
jgi:hypothetical protein